jgi:TolB-like protein/Flp pilus assembly protein TadD
VTKQAAAAPDDKSIAVLPFVNMSSDKEQEFFSDGISEELLNLLANIHELRVIARTSSFAFKGQNLEITEIAKRLNVAHVLEGSIRKSGNKLRITAQLIRTADQSHLWSETYDRKLDDIFKVQDEIAAAVVAQLRITLLGTLPSAKPLDPKVYPLVLQARFLAVQRTRESTDQALALYQQAMLLAPREARVLAGLAEVYLLRSTVGSASNADSFRMAREMANQALALDPDEALAHGALARIAAGIDLDFPVAAEHYQRALAHSTDSALLVNAGRFAAWLGRFDESIALQRYVTTHDPANPAGHYNLGLVYNNAGRYDEAIEEFGVALNLSPGYTAGHYGRGTAMLFKGDAAGALVEMQAEGEVWRAIGLPLAYHALGRKAEADAALASEIAQHAQDDAANIAYIHAFRGDADRCFEWLEKAIQFQDPGIASIAVERLFANVHKDPRWLPFLRKVGKAPEQLAAIKFEPKLPDSGP